MKDSVEFNGLIFFALDHGMESIKNNSGPLVPFVISYKRIGERILTRFLTDRLEQGIEKARKFVFNARFDLEMYAIAYDGYVTLEGQKYDAIIVEGGMRKIEQGMRLAQRYEKKGFIIKKNVPIGNPVQFQSDNPKSLIFIQNE